MEGTCRSRELERGNRSFAAQTSRQQAFTRHLRVRDARITTSWCYRHSGGLDFHTHFIDVENEAQGVQVTQSKVTQMETLPAGIRMQ